MQEAEMEISKAQNMLKHADEIYSRPKKIWMNNKSNNKTNNKKK
jgi:hypothetical protein